MAIKKITYDSGSKLSCNRCGDEVILCVDPRDSSSGAPFIEALLAEDMKIVQYSSQPKRYRYVFQFPEELLHPDTLVNGLQACDIKSVICKGCMTAYADYKAQEAADGVRADIAEQITSKFFDKAFFDEADPDYQTASDNDINIDAEVSIESPEFSFTNDTEKKMNVEVIGYSYFSLYNTHATEWLLGRARTYLSIDGVDDFYTQITDIREYRPQGHAEFFQHQVVKMLELTPGQTIKIKVHGAAVRTSGADNTKLKLQSMLVSPQLVFGVVK